MFSCVTEAHPRPHQSYACVTTLTYRDHSHTPRPVVAPAHPPLSSHMRTRPKAVALCVSWAVASFASRAVALRVSCSVALRVSCSVALCVSCSAASFASCSAASLVSWITDFNHSIGDTSSITHGSPIAVGGGGGVPHGACFCILGPRVHVPLGTARIATCPVPRGTWHVPRAMYHVPRGTLVAHAQRYVALVREAQRTRALVLGCEGLGIVEESSDGSVGTSSD